MAGNASNWYKPTRGLLKGRAVYVEKRRIADFFSFSKNAGRARMLDHLNHHTGQFPLPDIVNKGRPAAAAQPRRNASIHPAVGQRSQGAVAALEREMLADARETVRTDGRTPITDPPGVVKRSVEQFLKRIVDESDVAIRVPRRVLDAILSDGFKNQHATNKSKGTLAPDIRANAEHRMFDAPLLGDGTPDDYPIYGYYEPTGGVSKGVYYYGDVRITFKDAVKDRTTMAYGDSLSAAAAGYAIPAGTRSPRLSSVGYNLSRAYQHAKDGLSAKEALAKIDYAEAQIHGKVTHQDIARITFAKKPTRAMQQRLRDLGIDFDVDAELPVE